MSELKTYKMVDEKYCTDCVCVIPSEVYLKSEADKVIVEQTTLRAWAEMQLRHQKFKRCLAMAKWCMTEYIHSKCLDFTNTEQWYWRRWHIRWRNLAEKFKSNNQTAQQGKGK